MSRKRLRLRKSHIDSDSESDSSDVDVDVDVNMSLAIPKKQRHKRRRIIESSEEEYEPVKLSGVKRKRNSKTKKRKVVKDKVASEEDPLGEEPSYLVKYPSSSSDKDEEYIDLQDEDLMLADNEEGEIDLLVNNHILGTDADYDMADDADKSSSSSDDEDDSDEDDNDDDSDEDLGDTLQKSFKKILLKSMKERGTPEEERKRVIEGWLKDETEEQREKLTPIADKLYIKLSRMPKYVDILNSKMSFTDKYDMLTQLESLNNDDMPVYNYLSVKEDLLKKLDKYKRVKESNKELEEMEEQYTESTKDVSEPIKMRILKSNVSDSNKNILLEKAHRMEMMGSDDDSKHKLREWIEWGLKISDKLTPLNVKHSDGSAAINAYLWGVKEYMDKHLYGLKKAKERLLELLVTRITNPLASDTSLALVGPPGVGKTELVRVFAEATQQPFKKINMGGSTDPSHYLGHSFTYTGAMPGMIFRTLTSFKDSNDVHTKSGIMFFDEFDKIGSNSKIGHTFLHISDPVQQADFQDHYIAELKIDLSNIMFVYSLNYKDNIDRVLLDRLPVIELDGYEPAEKRVIVTDYLLPNILKNIGLNAGDITIDKEAVRTIINITESSDNKGIRKIKQFTQALVNKINALQCSTHADGKKIFSYQTDPISYPYVVTSSLVNKFKNEILSNNRRAEIISSMYI